MNRFLTFSWASSDRNSQATVHFLVRLLCSKQPAFWHTAFETPDMLVLLATERGNVPSSIRLSGDRGLIIGTLFRSENDPLATSLASCLGIEESRRIVDTRGKELIERYWGGYVAFIRGSDAEHYALRDPTGSVPCYFLRLQGITVSFSHIQDCLRIAPNICTVNWRHIATYLYFSRVVSRETGFEEIEQLHAGECRKILDLRARGTFHWQPAQVCAEETLEDPREAAIALQTAIGFGVRSWASRYRRILLELSGGIDSSIVLMCLADSQPEGRITCLNLYTANPAGDERFFARKAAERARCELIESIFEPTGTSLPRMLSAEPLISPTTVTFRSNAADSRAQLAGRKRIEAIFTGRGGDQLFQRRRGSFIATEYVHRHGLRSGLPKVVEDTARLSGTSVWSVWAAVVKESLLRRRCDPYAILTPPSFLHADANSLISYDELRHPWLNGIENLPQSKAWQIFDLIDTQNYFSGEACTYADFVPVLISQPIIECALRIPSYTLTHGGADRALLRRAFESRLPVEIATRKSKGEVSGFYQDLIRSNLSFIQEYLLGGALAKRGLLDGVRLARTLSHDQLIRGTDLVAVLNSIKAEHWLRTTVHG